ncbi:hypothetical protein, partial [Escherichia coli]|uniref:hypothetical protein n=1 Tax=Escherichia coli TaxID=562 RepID=UPI0038B397D6
TLLACELQLLLQDADTVLKICILSHDFCTMAIARVRSCSGSLVVLRSEISMLRIFMKGDHSITPCVSIVVASTF